MPEFCHRKDNRVDFFISASNFHCCDGGGDVAWGYPGWCFPFWAAAATAAVSWLAKDSGPEGRGGAEERAKAAKGWINVGAEITLTQPGGLGGIVCILLESIHYSARKHPSIRQQFGRIRTHQSGQTKMDISLKCCQCCDEDVPLCLIGFLWRFIIALIPVFPVESSVGMVIHFAWWAINISWEDLYFSVRKEITIFKILKCFS